MLRRNARLRAVGVPVTASVVDNQLIGGMERRVSFAPVLTYRTREGQQIKAVAEHRSNRSYIAGTTLEVQYDPERPERVLVPGQASGAWVALVFGVIFLGFAVVAGAIGSAVGDGFEFMFGDAPEAEFPEGWPTDIPPS